MYSCFHLAERWSWIAWSSLTINFMIYYKCPKYLLSSFLFTISLNSSKKHTHHACFSYCSEDMFLNEFFETEVLAQFWRFYWKKNQLLFSLSIHQEPYKSAANTFQRGNKPLCFMQEKIWGHTTSWTGLSPLLLLLRSRLRHVGGVPKVGQATSSSVITPAEVWPKSRD